MSSPIGQTAAAGTTVCVDIVPSPNARFATCPAAVVGAWSPEKRSLPAGSLFVPVNQPALESQTYEAIFNEAPRNAPRPPTRIRRRR